MPVATPAVHDAHNALCSAGYQETVHHSPPTAALVRCASAKYDARLIHRLTVDRSARIATRLLTLTQLWGRALNRYVFPREAICARFLKIRDMGRRQRPAVPAIFAAFIFCLVNPGVYPAETFCSAAEPETS